MSWLDYPVLQATQNVNDAPVPVHAIGLWTRRTRLSVKPLINLVPLQQPNRTPAMRAFFRAPLSLSVILATGCGGVRSAVPAGRPAVALADAGSAD